MTAIDDRVAEITAAGFDPGRPLGDETPLSAGRAHRRFERAWLLDAPEVGVWVLWGDVLKRYEEAGGLDELGFPRGAAVIGQDASWWWVFEQGSGFIHHSTGVFLTTDTLTGAWVARGGSDVFGGPTMDAQAVGGGWVLHTQSLASIHQPPVPANWVLSGRLNMEYWRLGGPDSGLGWPIADSVDLGDQVGTQTAAFEHGTLRTTTTGEVEVLTAPPTADRRAVAAQLLADYVPSDTGDERFGEVAKDYTGGGTTCGFLCHWLLWRLGSRDASLVNREEPDAGLHYVDGQNITRLFHKGVTPFVMTLDNGAIRDGARPKTGDCVYVKTDPSNPSGTGEHVFVFSHVEFDDAGNEFWHSADAGQRNAANQQCARWIVRRLTPGGARALLDFNGEARAVIGWIDLDNVEVST